VPKTIDNDLPLPGTAPTFGYETARHYGVQLVRNLDGRRAHHLPLVSHRQHGPRRRPSRARHRQGFAATLSIISEEFRGRPVTVDEVCDIIIGSIIKRKAEGSKYGLVVLAEGLIEGIGEKGLLAALPEGQLEHFGKIIRDDHGHLRLGEIEFGRLMKELLTQRLENARHPARSLLALPHEFSRHRRRGLHRFARLRTAAPRRPPRLGV
jgi:6-phosphofructokinase